MELVPRGFFKERRKNTEPDANYFPVEIREKILMLFNDFDLNNLDTSSVAVMNGPYSNDCLNLMKAKLKYILEPDQIENFEHYFTNCQLNDLFSCVELYFDCIAEKINRYVDYTQSDFRFRRAYATDHILGDFVKSFNNLLAYHKIPYRFTYNEVLKRLYIEEKFSKTEQQTRKEFVDLIKDEKANEYFTNSIVELTNENFVDSIENSYLTLERCLKVLTGNMEKDALHNYSDLQKKEFKGIFNLSEFKGKLKSQVAFVYGLRSKLKSHTPNEKFDEKEFLKETARFQLNEAMDLCILLNKIVKSVK